MSTQPEALPVVAWMYTEERFGRSISRLSSCPVEGRPSMELIDKATATARIAWLEQQLAHVKREAGVWKMEARTQKATVDATGAELGGIPDYGPIAASVRALRERAEAAEQQLAQAQMDARRYLALRDRSRTRLRVWLVDEDGIGARGPMDSNHLDDAIDAALSSSAEESKDPGAAA